MASITLSGKAGAALGGGAIGLLLGSKKGRKMGGKILTYGGLAALGVAATPLAGFIPEMMARFRRGGRFAKVDA